MDFQENKNVFLKKKAYLLEKEEKKTKMRDKTD
jgi:hypothetical protein